MKSIRQAIIDGHFVLDVDAQSMELILRHAVSQLVAQKVIPVDKRDEVEAALLARERQASTALGQAVAAPHAYLDAIREPVILFMRLAPPVNLGAPDGVSTHFVFVLLGPPDHAAEHLDSLAAIARLMSDNEFHYDAGRAANQQDLLSAFERLIETPERRFVWDLTVQTLDAVSGHAPQRVLESAGRIARRILSLVWAFRRDQSWADALGASWATRLVVQTYCTDPARSVRRDRAIREKHPLPRRGRSW